MKHYIMKDEKKRHWQKENILLHRKRDNMAFNTIAFVAFFIFVIIGYYVFPKRYKWVFLLGASYFFYLVRKRKVSGVHTDHDGEFLAGGTLYFEAASPRKAVEKR